MTVILHTEVFSYHKTRLKCLPLIIVYSLHPRILSKVGIIANLHVFHTTEETVKPGTYVDVWYHSSRTMDFKKEMKELMREDSLANAKQPEIKIDTIKETIETTDYEEEDEFEDEF